MILMSAGQSITDATFRSLAFQVAKARFAGPTNYRGSRYIATIRRDSERTYLAQVSYDDALSPGENALAAARACFAKSLADHIIETSEQDYVAIPGDLDADAYCFMFVPRYFFGEER